MGKFRIYGFFHFKTACTQLVHTGSTLIMRNVSPHRQVLHSYTITVCCRSGEFRNEKLAATSIYKQHAQQIKAKVISTRCTAYIDLIELYYPTSTVGTSKHSILFEWAKERCTNYKYKKNCTVMPLLVSFLKEVYHTAIFSCICFIFPFSHKIFNNVKATRIAF